jgi:predicted CXXCH cytochrome family protein
LDKQTWNVGSTNFGHPVGDNTSGTVGSGRNTYVTSVGGFTFDVNTATTIAWPAGNSGRIMCTSCHDVHAAVAGSMAIRNLGQTTTTVICKQCHNGIGFTNVIDVSKGGTATALSGVAEGPNVHHRTATAVTVGQHTPSGETAMTIAAPSWASTAPLGLGAIASGMDCADCHVFNGTAHNW